MKSLFFVLILIPQLFLFALQNDSIPNNEKENSSNGIVITAKRFAITIGIGAGYQKDGMNQIEHIFGTNSQISGEILIDNNFQWAIGFNHFYFKHFNENTRIGNSGNLMSIVLKKYIGSFYKNNTFVSVHLGGLPFPPRGIDLGLDVLHKIENNLLLRIGIRYISNKGWSTLDATEPIYGIEYSPTMITFGLTFVL